MASSFVTFNDEIGFWISDSMLEVTCTYIVQTIENQESEIPQWLLSMKELLKENSLGYYHSYMHLDLSEYLTTVARKDFFLNVLQITKNNLIKKGNYISKDELNSFVIDEKLQGRWTNDLETEKILKSIQYLELLITGKWQISVSDPITYW